MVGVVTHLRGEIKRDRKPARPLRNQIPVALIRLDRVAEAGVLPHRPEAIAIHAGMESAGVGEFARLGLFGMLRKGPGVTHETVSFRSAIGVVFLVLYLLSGGDDQIRLVCRQHGSDRSDRKAAYLPRDNRLARRNDEMPKPPNMRTKIKTRIKLANPSGSLSSFP